MQVNTRAKTKARKNKRSKVLFTPKDLTIFVLAFMYAATHLSIDSISKMMLFALYTMVSLMIIIIYKGV